MFAEGNSVLALGYTPPSTMITPRYIQSPHIISMRRDWHPYAYGAFMLVRRVDLSHINMFGTRADMLIGGL